MTKVSGSGSRPSTENSRGKRPRTTDSTDPLPITAQPWPRAPEKFELPSDWKHLSAKDILRLPGYRAHLRSTVWTEFDSLYYNGMCDVAMEPTRTLSEHTLRRLGLRKQMVQLMDALGLDTIATKYYPLYPDLARQFIATCQVDYTRYGVPSADSGILRFKSNGIQYTLSFTDICECFGFDAGRSRPKLPDGFRDSQIMWGEIGKDFYKASTSAQRDIRHPTLRLFVKALGHTLLCAQENNKMRQKHLLLLAYAIRDRWEGDHWFATMEPVNLGAVFAHHLEELKEKALSPTGKTESIGSLLTPLLERAGVYFPPGQDEMDVRVSLLDEDHLKRGNHIKPAGKTSSGAPRWCYEFLSMHGLPLFTLLPTRFAAIDTLEDLRFILPDSEVSDTRAHFARSSTRGSSSRGGRTDEAAAEDTDLPQYEPLGPYVRASEETIADTVAYRRHQETTMEKIWNFLRCTRVRDDVAPSTRPAAPREHSSTPDNSSEEF